MPSSSPPAQLERSKPLLGTLVAIRAEGPDPRALSVGIDAAFAGVAAIQDLMSFHDPDSELSRINRDALHRPVRVHPWTWRVLAFALELAQASGGVFDVSCGGEAVGAGVLPRPEGQQPDPAARWRDIELDEEAQSVRLLRPLWIDLGGVAKGFAVDVAVDRLKGFGIEQGCVDAGGDLRVFGPRAERVALRAPQFDQDLRVVELRDGAIASSGAGPTGPAAEVIHFDARRRRRIPAGRFASVCAPDAMDADALTKVVLAEGEASAPLLEHYGAWALVCDPQCGWRSLGAAA